MKAKIFDEAWLREYQSRQSPTSTSKRGSASPDIKSKEQEIARPAKREVSNTDCIYLPITPAAKPRMTRRDKWAKRPAVMKYRDFCDQVRENWPETPFPAAGGHVIFHVPMPVSWSKKKKTETNGKPHQQRPDADNFLKAIFDALHDEDSHIYDCRVSKYWSEQGYIEIYLNEMRKAA